MRRFFKWVKAYLKTKTTKKKTKKKTLIFLGMKYTNKNAKIGGRK